MTVNINDEDFVMKFDISKGVVGQVGYGYIGKAVEALFIDRCKVLVYDKFVPGTSTLEEVLAESQIIFVAVPTPMDRNTGECHTKIIEDVLADIQRVALEIERNTTEFVVVIKSTVPPGFTRKMQVRHALRILFSPEFLTEANSVADFRNTKRVLLGGEIDDARVAFKYFEGVWPDRIPENYDGHPSGPVVIAQCEPEVAEMVKLTTNTFLMTKVVFFNEIYQICQKLGVKYEEVRLLTLLDSRVGQSHTLVPGPDGHYGAGGHCFPKDANSLKFFSKQLGVDEKLFTSVLDRNNELRDEKDWEKMTGRAVIDKNQ